MSYQPTMIQAYLEWTALRAAWKAKKVLPQSAMDKIVNLSATLSCALGSTMKGKTAEKYLTLLGEDATAQRCHLLCEGMIASFLRTLLEQGDISEMLASGPREFVEFHHLDRLDAALARGKGAVLTSVHLGNWEMSASALTMLGYPLKIVAWEARNSFIQKHIQKVREQSGMMAIFPDAHAQIRIYRYLKLNCPVAFVLDIGEWEKGVPVKFCGGDYLFPRGPLFFAQRTGAELIPTINYRGEDGRLHLVFEKPVDVPQRSESYEPERDAMQKLADILEKYVRAHPEQWLWVPSDGEFISEMRQNNHKEE